MEYTNNCMYNGVELPAPPANAPHDYLFIVWYDAHGYMLVSSSAMPMVSGTDVIWNGGVSTVAYGLENETWVQDASGNRFDSVGSIAGGYFLWTNATIYNTDGSVHLKGTSAIRISTDTEEIKAGVAKTWIFQFMDGDEAVIADPKATYVLEVTNDVTGESVDTGVNWINMSNFPTVYIYSTSPEHHTVCIMMTWQDAEGLTYRGYKYIVIGEAEAVEPDPEPEEPAVKPFAIDLKSLQTGLSLGLSGGPMSPAKKTPIAYLYNGVRLPKLPEWDREKYPYAQINFFEHYEYGETYVVTFTNLRPHWKGDGVYPPAYCDYCESSLVDGKWTNFDYGHYYVTAMFKPLWTNFDVLNEDGSIHMAASEPIPVYE